MLTQHLSTFEYVVKTTYVKRAPCRASYLSVRRTAAERLVFQSLVEQSLKIGLIKNHAITKNYTKNTILTACRINSLFQVRLQYVINDLTTRKKHSRSCKMYWLKW